ncbi:hypothetical protein J6590_004414 [Homalodisca vitripennis]|nr:hypothetical protein J6590_004414 [Homalodisca vitripennis]
MERVQQLGNRISNRLDFFSCSSSQFKAFVKRFLLQGCEFQESDLQRQIPDPALSGRRTGARKIHITSSLSTIATLCENLLGHVFFEEIQEKTVMKIINNFSSSEIPRLPKSLQTNMTPDNETNFLSSEKLASIWIDIQRNCSSRSSWTWSNVHHLLWDNFSHLEVIQPKKRAGSDLRFNMDVDLGSFKHIFLIETFFGTNTVSVATLKQSRWRIAYSGMHLTLHLLNEVEYWVIQYVFHQPVTTLALILRLFKTSLPTYCLIRAIWDRKTKVSCALALAVIEQRLENPTVLKKIFCKVGIAGIVVTHLCLYFMNQTILQENHLRNSRIVNSIFAMNNFGILLGQSLGLIFFLTKLASAEKLVIKNFTDLYTQKALGVVLPGTTRNIVNEDRNQDSKQLKELLVSMRNSDEKIRSCYWFQVVFFRLFTEVAIPMIFVTFVWSERSFYIPIQALSLMHVIVYISAIAYAAERVGKEKEDVRLMLSSAIVVLKNDSRGPIKHQLIASHHRSPPFSCYFFDVEFSMLLDILGNAMFVAVTLFEM